MSGTFFQEVRRSLPLAVREIANSTRAPGKGDFASLEKALTAAEPHRNTLLAELAQLDGNQPAVLQLTPAALERRREGLTEKLRSGVNGKVRVVIQQSVARILVDVDGTLTIEAKPGGLLGLEGNIAQLNTHERQGVLEHGFASVAGRQWRVITAGQAVVGVAHP